jgi:uncharacterized DUF497 family protein
MGYDWDPAKDAVNRRKHGLSLAAGIPALQDPNAYFWIDNRFDYDEARTVTLGRNEQSILVVVSTEKIRSEDNEEEIVRIISVRKAVSLEVDWYYAGRRGT